MKPKIKPTTRQDELMVAFNLSWRDLDANRQGLITKQHGRKVLVREQKQWVGLLFLGIIFLGILACVGITGITNNDAEIFLPLFCMFLFGLSLIIIPVYQWILVSSEIDVGRVEVIQGITVVDTDSRGSQSVSIGSLKLKANRNALLRIKHLEPHIVYFLPRSKIIVSVEVVES